MVHTPIALRLSQVMEHLRTDDELAPTLPPDALARLNEPMLHQFRILSVADQKHAIRVYHRLLNQAADDDTITAGLIHDVGKACGRCRITVVDRAMNVVLRRLLPPVHQFIGSRDTAPEWLRGIHRLASHAERGARAAEQAGYSARVISLVRHHERGGDSSDAQLHMLRRADSQS